MENDLAEAKRRLSQSRTLYARLCQKNAKAEEDYRAKIERQQALVEHLEASR